VRQSYWCWRYGTSEKRTITDSRAAFSDRVRLLNRLSLWSQPGFKTRFNTLPGLFHLLNSPPAHVLRAQAAINSVAKNPGRPFDGAHAASAAYSRGLAGWLTCSRAGRSNAGHLVSSGVSRYLCARIEVPTPTLLISTDHRDQQQKRQANRQQLDRELERCRAFRGQQERGIRY
jgi:hypothetical protein